MTNLLGDWQDFCEGRKKFDKSHFYTLFAVDPKVLSRENLRKIFSYFPNSDELIERMSNILAAGFSKEGLTFPHKDASVPNEQLLKLAMQDLQQKRRICERLGDTELLSIIDGVEPVVVSDIQKVEEQRRVDGPNAWLHELINDHLSDLWVLKDKKTYALFEAFYGLTTDFNLVWYAGAPLIKEDINLNCYLELWRLGGIYVLTRDKLLVTRRR